MTPQNCHLVSRYNYATSAPTCTHVLDTTTTTHKMQRRPHRRGSRKTTQAKKSTHAWLGTLNAAAVIDRRTDSHTRKKRSHMAPSAPPTCLLDAGGPSPRRDEPRGPPIHARRWRRLRPVCAAWIHSSASTWRARPQHRPRHITPHKSRVMRPPAVTSTDCYAHARQLSAAPVAGALLVGRLMCARKRSSDPACPQPSARFRARDGTALRKPAAAAPGRGRTVRASSTTLSSTRTSA